MEICIHTSQHRDLLNRFATQLNEKSFSVVEDFSFREESKKIGSTIKGSARIDDNKLLCKVELDQVRNINPSLVWGDGAEIMMVAAS